VAGALLQVAWSGGCPPRPGTPAGPSPADGAGPDRLTLTSVALVVAAVVVLAEIVFG
jgi:hypothetical protein